MSAINERLDGHDSVATGKSPALEAALQILSAQIDLAQANLDQRLSAAPQATGPSTPMADADQLELGDDVSHESQNTGKN